MPTCNIYLDESGDLGFKFHAPYRAGGSSRHLTLGAVICEGDCSKHVKRFVTKFYEKRKIPRGTELKWAHMDAVQRMDFATRARQLIDRQVNVRYACMTVYKPNVMPHIQADPNKLYNYMVGLLLLPTMKQYDHVCFVPDSRSVKVKSGNSLHDYLQTKLWFDEGATTELDTKPSESTNNRPLNFADYLCGTFQSHFEDGASVPHTTLAPYTSFSSLFFPHS